MNESEERVIAMLLIAIAVLSIVFACVYVVGRDADVFSGCLARGFKPSECQTRH